MKHGIIRLKPVLKENIWGGEKLKTEWNYHTDLVHVGECWGISAHENGDCTVYGHDMQEMHLSELYTTHKELFGTYQCDKFPLLVKIIDAKDDLSIQVHPDDAYAAKYEHGSLGKMECWYILEAKEDAQIILGHHARNERELTSMIQKQNWENLLQVIPVKKGDFIQIDPGTIHAIKGGITLLETQQNSDITYRLYDYDRKTNGVARELHIKKSIDVIKVPSVASKDCVKHIDENIKNIPVLLESCAYYKVWLLQVKQTSVIPNSSTFINVSVIDGNGNLEGENLKKGDHFIIPANCGNITISGDVKLVYSSVNESNEEIKK